MAETFELSVITPEKVFFKGQVTMATVPGEAGDFGVMQGHEAFISTLKPGVLTVETENSGMQRIAVLGGLAEVNAEHCSVLAETAETITDMTAADAETRLRTAEAAREAAITEEEKQQSAHDYAMAEIIRASFA